MAADRIEAIVDRTTKGGAEIVGLLKTGSAFTAPAAATIEMVDAILRDERRILPCCTLLGGQWGVENAYVGAPVLLGDGGILEVYEPPVSESEAAGSRLREMRCWSWWRRRRGGEVGRRESVGTERLSVP